jgi:hypothetical protein
MGLRARILAGAALALILLGSALGGSVHRAAATGSETFSTNAAPGVVRTGTMPRFDAATRHRLSAALRRSTGGTKFVCSPAASQTNTATTQSCTISASKGVCIERSTNPSVTQQCIFNQGNTSGPNVAVSVQVIEQRDGGQSGSKSQSGRQDVFTRQTNGSGANVNWSVQIIKQFLGRGADNRDDEESQQQQKESQQEGKGTPADFTSFIQSLEPNELSQENANDPAVLASTSSPVAQTQQSQQTIDVCQGAAPDPCTTGGTGTNVNGNYQSLRQWEWAAKAPSIAQDQNSTPGDCSEEAGSVSLNMCSLVHQNTNGGKNLSGLFEVYRQFQRALHTLAGHQVQDAGDDLGGLGHDVFQLSAGDPSGPQREWILTGQRARQVQRANDVGAMTQTQDPHVSKGYLSSQAGTTHDTWRGWIRSDQKQLADGVFAPLGEQSQTLTYDADSTGDIVANVQGTSNGSTANDQCAPGDTGDSCHIGVSCYGGESNASVCEALEESATVMRRR